MLTAKGAEKLRKAIESSEYEERFGQKFTLEELSTRVALDQSTVSKIRFCKQKCDLSSIERFYSSFNIDLHKDDYHQPYIEYQFQNIGFSQDEINLINEPDLERLVLGHSSDFLISTLKPIFKFQILQVLQSANIFQRRWLKDHVSKIFHNSTFQKLAGSKANLIHYIDSSLSTSHRLGSGISQTKIHQILCESKPIICGIPADLAASLAIFYYLKCVKGYNFEIDYQFAHTIEMTNALAFCGRFQEQPHLAVFTEASAARLLCSNLESEYSPFTLMPQQDYRIISPKPQGGKTLLQTEIDRGHYMFMTDPASTTGLHFEDLISQKIIQPTHVSIDDMEPDEITPLLANANDDLRTVTWFPHYYLNCVFNDCRIIPSLTTEADTRSAMLFIHKSLLHNTEIATILEVVIRDAWWVLSKGGKALDSVVDLILNDSEYVSFLERRSGLRYMRKLSN